MRVLVTCLAAVAVLPASAQAGRLELGLSSHPGEAAAMRKAAPFGYRYQYLAGGVNTGAGWATWNENGTFVTRYVAESYEQRITPVFSYYMIRQSLPGRDMEEATGVLHNLRDPSTMKSYWRDVEMFMRRAAATHERVVLHFEPDMWGYLEQARQAGLARSIAKHVVRLRNRLARNVVLAYHLSEWGTRTDLSIQNPPNRTVDRLAAKSAAFYRALGVRFDTVFAEFSDRDSGFKEHIYGQPHDSAWWNTADFARHTRFLGRFSRLVRRPLVLWQIPLGNRGLADTWAHFKDNRPEWLLGAGSRRHLVAYARAGVTALLFGGGADGTTSEKTDGGWFLGHARAYYKRPIKVGS